MVGRVPEGSGGLLLCLSAGQADIFQDMIINVAQCATLTRQENSAHEACNMTCKSWNAADAPGQNVRHLGASITTIDCKWNGDEFC